MNFELIEGPIPESIYAGKNQDFGFMLYDIDFDDEMRAVFFRAEMHDGVIDVGKCLVKGGVS